MKSKIIKTKITNIINEWDPYYLFPDAPPYEYEPEISRILSVLPKVSNYYELGLVIKKIFEESFAAEFFKEECIEIAPKIMLGIYRDGNL
ncbi:DUF1871 family protein [Caldicoprobacter faecalis]|uniref:DUF1871 family protein n=1 Tax=Caldicoprobacter faecalis TaxID=937334 RepID=UPI0015A6E00B